ncbi:MAG: metallophosphoesterase [bacterium]
MIPSYIEKYDLNEISEGQELKIISIGDLHGNFAALDFIIINLIKERILTADLKLANDYKIVCLGDYVDRGQQSLEIVTVFMLLRLLNPDNVILLKGNHESEIKMMQFYGFAQELQDSLGDFQFNQTGLVTDFFLAKFNCYFYLLPNAYFLKNNNGELFQFNHAGWVDLSIFSKFFSSDKKFFEITPSEVQEFIWNDIEESANSFSYINRFRGAGIIFSSGLVLGEMRKFKVIAKFGGHQHEMPKEDFYTYLCESQGFTCIKDGVSSIFILISGTIGESICYYPSYLQLSINDKNWNVCGFYGYSADIFFNVPFY